MALTMVIKVTYGDTLRRFNANVDENDQLDLDMTGLKAKVLSLFSFNPDADITLTYIDEDGDVVTLVDDDDLRDVMRQQLKFLRIDVQLNNDKGGRTYARSSGSSTPLRFPRIQHPLPNMNYAAAQVLKSLPEPLRASLVKLSLDAASKASESSPIVADLVESFTRVGLSLLSTHSGPKSVGETSESPQAPSAATGSDDNGNPKVSSSSKSNQEVPETSQVEVGNVTGGFGATVTLPFPSVDLNKLPADYDSSEPMHVKSAPSAVDGDGRKEKDKEVKWGSINLPKGKSVGSEASPSSSLSTKQVNVGPSQTPDGCSKPFNECPFSGLPLNPTLPPVSFRPFHPFKRNHAEAMGGIFHRGIRCDGCGVHPITGPRFKSKVKEDYDLCNICFSEMGNDSEYIRIDRPIAFRHPRSFKGTHEQHSWGGWGGSPVLPPHVMRGCGLKHGRPKLDSRFIVDVNVVDGTLMAPSSQFTKIWRMRNNGGLVWPRGTQLVWIGGDRFSDSLSVDMEIPADGVPVDGELDIAVDFTAPEDPGRYISYWRMASPTGQKFGQRVWALIMVDVSLNNSFSSSLQSTILDPPSLTGGTKGSQVIDVNVNADVEPEFLVNPWSYVVREPEQPVHEQKPKDEQEQNFPTNDNLLVGHGVSFPSATEAVSPVSYPIIDLTDEDSNIFFSKSAPAAPAPAPAAASSAPFPILPSAPAPAAASLAPFPILPSAPAPAPAPAPAATSSAPFPILPPAPAPAPPPAATSLAPSPISVLPSEGTSASIAVEESLLRELEEMGFKQVNLNKEILRMNEYNLEQSLDDLCGVAEWDPILDELQEMGFSDTETNKRLLAKNNGSLKRVVMDLVNGEKA